MKPGRICDCRLNGVRQSQNNLFGTSQSLLSYPFFYFVLESSYKCSSSITALRNMRNNANYRPIAELLLNECDLSNGKLVEDNLSNHYLVYSSKTLCDLFWISMEAV